MFLKFAVLRLPARKPYMKKPPEQNLLKTRQCQKVVLTKNPNRYIKNPKAADSNLEEDNFLHCLFQVVTVQMSFRSVSMQIAFLGQIVCNRLNKNVKQACGNTRWLGIWHIQITAKNDTY